MLCPGFSRTMTSSHHEDGCLNQLSWPRIDGSAAKGSITSVVRPTSTPKNPGGVTPTIVNGIRCTVSLAADDVLGGAEVLSPEAMTDDDDRAIRRGAAVVGRCEQAPAHGAHTEFIKESSTYVCAVDGLCAAATREIEGLGRPRERAGEQLGLPRPNLLPHGIGPRSVGQQREAGRVADGQRPKNQAVEDREQRRVGADAERQRTDDGECESGALAQATPRVANVLPHAVDGADRPGIARLLEGERHVAHRPPARVQGVSVTETVALQRVLTMRPMCLDLRSEVGVVTRAVEQVQQTAHERGHDGRPFRQRRVRIRRSGTRLISLSQSRG